jgi:hypothetical protein
MPDAHEPITTPARSLWLGWLCALALAVISFWAFTRHQEFPFYYHTDEPSKTNQLIRSEFNFRHPLLLLDTTEALMRAAGTPRQPQPVVEKGRTASALFAALSVAAMTLLAWQLAGAWAGLLGGLLTATHPVLFELAHYMKEDCALLFGITWAALAVAAYGRRPTLTLAALAGLAAGLAVSGKYLGAVMSGTALLAVALTPRESGRRWAAVLVATLAMVACFAAVNSRGIANINRLSSSISEELDKVEKRAEQREEGIKFKHLSKLGTSLSVPLLVALAWWIGRRWRTPGPIAYRVLAAFTVGYFLLVSLAPKTKDRYVLPVYVLACGLGAAAIVEWTRAQPAGSKRRWIGPALAAVALGWHGPELIANWRGFARDDRQELTAWLREHVPPADGIAHDIRAHLRIGQESGLPGYVLPNPLYAPDQRYVADVGTIDELRARGVTHIVACEADYHSALARGESRRKAFYEELFAHHTKVWERAPGPLPYLHPGLTVYALKPAPGGK